MISRLETVGELPQPDFLTTHGRRIIPALNFLTQGGFLLDFFDTGVMATEQLPQEERQAPICIEFFSPPTRPDVLSVEIGFKPAGKTEAHPYKLSQVDDIVIGEREVLFTGNVIAYGEEFLRTISVIPHEHKIVKRELP